MLQSRLTLNLKYETEYNYEEGKEAILTNQNVVKLKYEE